MKTLEDVRTEWERGLTLLSVIEIHYRDSLDEVLVILEKPQGVYHCHRYFPIGNNWNVSVDGQNVPLEAVFSWLNSPTAKATRPLSYVRPKYPRTKK